MRCPSPQELPPPPPGKHGWPWTASTSPGSAEHPDDGMSWPRVSIVTPSLNQGEFIEETIRSVLLQGYPDLEYIIVDGGSTDGTVDIIRKYEPWIAFWTSEPDRGQSHAINKGFDRTSGTITNWLNSDDILLPDALFILVPEFTKTQEAVVFGDCLELNMIEGTQTLRKSGYRSRDDHIKWWTWKATLYQQAVFFRRSVFFEAGALDENLHYAMDFDIWLKLSKHYPFRYVEKPLAAFRAHAGAKTAPANFDRYFPEIVQVSRKHWGSRVSTRYYGCLVSLTAFRLKRKSKALYGKGARFSEQGRSLRSAGYFLASILAYPPNILNRFYVASFARELAHAKRTRRS